MPKLKALSVEHDIPLGVPFKTLSKEHQKMLLHGAPGFRGVFPFLERLKLKAYKSSNRFLVKRYQESILCQTWAVRSSARRSMCGGTERPEISAMTVGCRASHGSPSRRRPARRPRRPAELLGRPETGGRDRPDYSR